jgi:hypothetical protein
MDGLTGACCERWTPLYEDSSFVDNVKLLHQQLLRAIGFSKSQAADDSGEAVAASPNEAKEELARLRDEELVSDPLTSAAAMADPSEPAKIPAGVPKLPPRFRSTEQIAQLTQLVLSTSPEDMSMSKVGFYGEPTSPSPLCTTVEELHATSSHAQLCGTLKQGDCCRDDQVWAESARLSQARRS